MNQKLSITHIDNDADVSDLPVETPELALGQWYWVKDTSQWSHDVDDEGNELPEGAEYRWLGCVIDIGSNYVKVQAPKFDNISRSKRVHFDEFDEILTFEPNADRYIERQRQFFQQRVNALLGQAQELTTRLGIVPTRQVAHESGEGQNALVVLSTQPDTDAYKQALIKASEETLPEIFAQIGEANKHLTRWMIAPTLPLQATIGPMEESIDAVKDRIHTIELYAGLTEEAVKCRDGKPAAMEEKLHIMQRRLYMDEECLCNYRAGGMSINDIHQFDKWISKKENRDRILPFPRTLVAFRVRRKDKEREDDGNMWRILINIRLQEADKKTFLYVRNGEQVWRVDCDFEFDEMIVPEKDHFNPSEPMMVLMSYGRIEDMIPKSRYDFLCAEDDERKRKLEEWQEANPGTHWINNPYRHTHSRFESNRSEYRPFDPSDVYYDDALREVEAEIKKYNRIAVIVQGLFDRSEVLHPHAPVRIWDPESFSRSVELVYDAMTLTYGDPPDFEAYRAELNAQITADSIMTGQEEAWMRREAERINKRRENDRNYRGSSPEYTRYRPYGDPGPCVVGPMDEWKPRARKGVFRWKKNDHYNRQGEWVQVGASVEVPVDQLLNVSAYKPGDYKRFYADPRTRVNYLKWAPLLLVAEDYHANGKTEFQNETTWES